MKARKTIGAIVAIIGLFAAVCVMDGSAHELLIRVGGVATFIAGVLIMP